MVVWGISSKDSQEDMENFRDQLDLTFPLLYDPDAEIEGRFFIGDKEVESALYPSDWIVGADGRVAYVNNVYEPDEMKRVIEEELGGE